jgi:hypothetical protein
MSITTRAATNPAIGCKTQPRNTDLNPSVYRQSPTLYLSVSGCATTAHNLAGARPARDGFVFSTPHTPQTKIAKIAKPVTLMPTPPSPRFYRRSSAARFFPTFSRPRSFHPHGWVRFYNPPPPVSSRPATPKKARQNGQTKVSRRNPLDGFFMCAFNLYKNRRLHLPRKLEIESWPRVCSPILAPKNPAFEPKSPSFEAPAAPPREHKSPKIAEPVTQPPPGYPFSPTPAYWETMEAI